jgi:polyhydroxybutyrate depolymerase
MNNMTTPVQRLFLALILTLLCFASSDARAADPTRREWTIDSVQREALVYVPDSAKTNASPVVFAFHGHGGNMRQIARSFHIHELWPEAIVVYMQGLNTPGRLTDPEGKKPGWQHGAGEQGDRDLKFFDEVLATLRKEYKVDNKRIFATGHSNGGGFTYLLWTTRAEQFTAFAPSAAVGRGLLRSDEKLWNELMASHPLAAREREKLAKDEPVPVTRFIPKPVLHVAGDNDPLVKYEWQKLMIGGLKKFNQCSEPKPWPGDERCSIYESKVGAPIVTYVHHEKHSVPPEVPGIIVTFFKSFQP